MCFSAPVSFAAGLILVGIGAASLREPLRPVEKPFAFIPLLFGAQQVIEGLLWLILPGQTTGLAGYLLVQVYVLFAGAVWPVLVPLSLRLMETDSVRRRMLAVLLGGGLATALYTITVFLSRGFEAAIVNQCIVYSNPAGVLPGMLAFYAVVVCVPFFISSDAGIRWIGAAQVLGLAVSWLFYRSSLPSVWCFFAALISVLIYFHLRSRRQVEKEMAVSP